ncbi:unnamed protein product [Effrenium voratum]|nr:unnamed protein product [Effrenium voratum]CAJ1436225.1 unnamed protein product [Effrenium voratum]|mmetsp:Transcript_114241/g.271950  ORF Transcript_114241/g.271950 Transcript_114241/m.271950 type:complete len:242 (+) Transcript_114241:80-805(+)
MRTLEATIFSVTCLLAASTTSHSVEVNTTQLKEDTPNSFTWLQVLQEPAKIQQIRIRWPTPGEIALHMAVAAAITTGAALAFRHFVKAWPEVHEDAIAKEKLNVWSSGPFDCFQDMSSCCWTCWCPGVRWAANVDMMGFFSFWPAFLLFLALELLSTVPLGSICCCSWLAVLTYYRNKMRVVFGMQGANECPTICGDCVFVTCCTGCAICQEARHIQTAATLNHEATAPQRPLMAPVQETA